MTWNTRWATTSLSTELGSKAKHGWVESLVRFCSLCHQTSPKMLAIAGPGVRPPTYSAKKTAPWCYSSGQRFVVLLFLIALLASQIKMLILSALVFYINSLRLIPRYSRAGFLSTSTQLCATAFEFVLISPPHATEIHVRNICKSDEHKHKRNWNCASVSFAPATSMETAGTLASFPHLYIFQL